MIAEKLFFLGIKSYYMLIFCGTASIVTVQQQQKKGEAVFKSSYVLANFKSESSLVTLTTKQKYCCYCYLQCGIYNSCLFTGTILCWHCVMCELSHLNFFLRTKGYVYELYVTVG